MRVALIACGLAACFEPRPVPGVPCADNGACPAGLVCVPRSFTCERTPGGTHGDAGIDPDASLADAVDAPCIGSVELELTGEIETFVVPDCASRIAIEAWGASGGNGPTASAIGGRGARASGTFELPRGATLRILVGERGRDAANGSTQAGGSGGGGSFVALADDTPLLVAGGGGGGSINSGGGAFPGGHGQADTAGQAGGGNGGAGGTDGSGGGTWPWQGWHSGTGGGGFSGDGSADSNGAGQYGSPNGRGRSFLSGGAGGAAGSQGRAGGFGGGGAAGFTGAGGGGYSGGGSANALGQAQYGGGGGGSFSSGSASKLDSGVQDGNGRVTLSWE
jgi:hypothetical protein